MSSPKTPNAPGCHCGVAHALRVEAVRVFDAAVRCSGSAASPAAAVHAGIEEGAATVLGAAAKRCVSCPGRGLPRLASTPAMSRFGACIRGRPSFPFVARKKESNHRDHPWRGRRTRASSGANVLASPGVRRRTLLRRFPCQPQPRTEADGVSGWRRIFAPPILDDASEGRAHEVCGAVFENGAHAIDRVTPQASSGTRPMLARNSHRCGIRRARRIARRVRVRGEEKRSEERRKRREQSKVFVLSVRPRRVVQEPSEFG